MEELHIQKSSDLPNNNLIFRFELHFGYNMEPLYSIWSCNRTFPKLYSVFIEGRENAREINATDSDNPNVYVRDIVAVFKPLLGLTP